MKFTPRDLFQLATFAVFALWTFGLSVAVGYAAAMFNISYKLAAGEQVVGQQVLVNAATWSSVAFVAFYVGGMYWLFKLAFYSEQAAANAPKVVEVERVPLPSGYHEERDYIPATEAQLKQLANAIFWGGKNFTNAMGEPIFGGRPGYEAMRDYLLKNGVITWRRADPQGGLEIVDALWFAQRADKERTI